jgi:hypothetical protein
MLRESLPSLPGYGPVISVNRPVSPVLSKAKETRMPGGVVAVGENPRLPDSPCNSFFQFCNSNSGSVLLCHLSFSKAAKIFV